MNVFHFVFERKYKLLKYLLKKFCWSSFYFVTILLGCTKIPPFRISDDDDDKNNNNNNRSL